MQEHKGEEIRGDTLEGASIEQIEKELSTSKVGLTSDEAKQRLTTYGYNELEEKKQSMLLRLLMFFWGPIPWMIEAAAILSAVVGHWEELYIILFLLVFNAGIGFWQDVKASSALDALKGELAITAHVLRDGKVSEIPARELVPGDVVKILQGDIIPADVILIDGKYLSVDQSALTGESLPVDKAIGDPAYSGSVARQGEMVGYVTQTGMHTRFGETAKLVQEAGSASHLQRAVLHIADYLIYMSLGLAALLVVFQVLRGDSAATIFQFVLILVVASIPVALPAVISVTMALGALALSRDRAIVSRLQSIEELAGVDILCSDKTGTLTQNKLTLGEVVPFGGAKPADVILAGAMASESGNPDPIDQSILKAVEDSSQLSAVETTDFVPFDPVHKRTEATLATNEATFRVTKGAPQVIIGLCDIDADMVEKAERIVDELAGKGYRTLGVARAEGTDGPWKLLGILPLSDPPREDSAGVIQRAIEHGVCVKMVTGDNLAIAREMGEQLGTGSRILSAEQVFGSEDSPEEIGPHAAAAVEEADGFAEVYPEHKYEIVRSLQQRGHIVAMTGDGVNDAPALKQADVGIAVSGATNAARSAAALVLTLPGLSVIIRAIEESRRIFERLNSYTTYRIAETIRILFFVALTMIVLNFYPLNAVLIILLAVLNDLPIMFIAYDNTWLAPKPVRWDLRRVLTVATMLGLAGVISTFGILLIGLKLLHLSGPALQSLIYLKLAVAGHLTLFVARSKRPFYRKPYPAWPLLTAILATQAAAVLIVGFGLFVERIPWAYVGYVWAYAIFWMFLLDAIKVAVHRHLDLSGRKHRSFLELLQRSLHSHVR